MARIKYFVTGTYKRQLEISKNPNGFGIVLAISGIHNGTDDLMKQITEGSTKALSTALKTGVSGVSVMGVSIVDYFEDEPTEEAREIPLHQA